MENDRYEYRYEYKMTSRQQDICKLHFGTNQHKICQKSLSFYNFRDLEIYVYIQDQELESNVTLWAGVSIGTKNSAPTDLGRAITAALSSLF